MISLIQTQSGSSGAYTNSFTIVIPANVTAGSLLILNVTSGTADTLSSITDNNGNTWTQAVASVNPTTGERASFLYYVKNANAGATTITITWTAGQFPDTSYICREYSGLDTSSPLDVTSTNNDGTNYNQTHDAGTTAAISVANELVILGGGASANADPTAVAGSGYGNSIEQKGFDLYTYSFMSDKIVSSTGTQSGNFATTSFVRGQGFIATFKQAAVANTQQEFTMMGVGA